MSHVQVAAAAAATGHLSWLEAAVVGLLQGVTELFPISSLGHSVLLPAIIGGSWARDLSVSSPESPYLAFIVGLHVATAIALIVYFWRDWVRIVGGVFSSVRRRKVETADERLAWLLILATIPVGLTGLLLEHTFRTVLAKPVPTAIFLMLNGVVLLVAEWYRRRSAEAPVAAEEPTHGGGTTLTTDRRIAKLPVRRAVLIGSAQIAALAPGISRSGVTMAAGLRAGLSHQDAARFSFLLATPVILAAGVLKIPDLFGPLGAGIHGQVLLGSVLSGLAAYASVRFSGPLLREQLAATVRLLLPGRGRGEPGAGGLTATGRAGGAGRLVTVRRHLDWPSRGVNVEVPSGAIMGRLLRHLVRLLVPLLLVAGYRKPGSHR